MIPDSGRSRATLVPIQIKELNKVQENQSRKPRVQDKYFDPHSQMEQ